MSPGSLRSGEAAGRPRASRRRMARDPTFASSAFPPPPRPPPEACIVIDFTLTEENRLVRESARAFAEAEIQPHIRDWDANGEVHREVFTKMGALGFLGAPIPERYGGSGMDYISFALLCEELERA